MGYPKTMTENRFQEQAEQRIRVILAEHGLQIHFDRTTDSWGEPLIRGSFTWDGDCHVIEVFVPSIVMMVRGRLYELYLSREFASESAMIDSFCVRLDRFLSSGSWEGPDERGGVRRVLSRLLGRGRGVGRDDKSGSKDEGAL
jgi:hypothetical protein